MTPWYACAPFIPFDVYYHHHPVMIVQRRTWQVATRLGLYDIRQINKRHPWIRWQRRTLANTLRHYRKPPKTRFSGVFDPTRYPNPTQPYYPSPTQLFSRKEKVEIDV